MSLALFLTFRHPAATVNLAELAAAMRLVAGLPGLSKASR